MEYGKPRTIYLFAEKATFIRLIKNAQMQGARNPEKDRRPLLR
jgi:hypothetical protein